MNVCCQVADLLNTIKDYRASAPNLARVLDYSERDIQQLQVTPVLTAPYVHVFGFSIFDILVIFSNNSLQMFRSL